MLSFYRILNYKIKIFLYYEFKYSKFTIFKFIILILISIFIFLLLFINNNFLNNLENYYLTIDNFYLKTIIDFIIDLDLINLNNDILTLFLILFMFYLFIIMLFILSFWLKLFRLVLAFSCGKLITFYFNFTSDILFNINSVINFSGLNISRKLSDIDKVEYFYQLKDQYIFNLDENYFLDFVLNSENINLFLSNYSHINNMSQISLLFNDVLRSHTYSFQDNVDNLDTYYILYIGGALAIILVSYLLYITISTIIQDSQNNTLALENLNIKMDNISNNFKETIQDLNTKIDIENFNTADNLKEIIRDLNTKIDQVNLNTIDNFKEIIEDMGTLEGKVDELSLDVKALDTRVDDISKDLGTLEDALNKIIQTFLTS